MLTIFRNGLTITSNGNLLPARGSVNVPLALESDNTYLDYTPQIHCGFFNGYKVKEVILEKEKEHWLIPKESFLQNGPLYISVGLVKDNEILKTNQQVFNVDSAPNGKVILPNEDIWQKVVEDYIGVIYGRDYKTEFEQELTKLNNIVDQAENIVTDINGSLANGDFIGQQGPQGIQGEKGDKGDPGESGVITQINGFFTLSVDDDGNLWAHHSDDELIPNFEYDNETGNLYLIT